MTARPATRLSATLLSALVSLAAAVSPSSAGEADVTEVVASEQGDGLWRFDVTVSHADEGWDHYADKWQVLDPANGAVLGERVLLHPHVTEQPFTRSLSGVAIPPEVTTVRVRAHDSVHGWGGIEATVKLP